jgi:hypothetical protein
MSEERGCRPGELVPLDARASIDRVIDRARDAGDLLRAAPAARVISAIARAAAALADPAGRLGAQARAAILARSHLSEANVEHGLATTLSELREERLRAALAAFERAHAQKVTVPVCVAGFVLAGNVFTASLRPLAWALLLRVPVVIKLSSEDEGLTELFSVALGECDAELGDAVALLRFARHEAPMLDAMASRCDVVHVWGSDHSLAAIRAAIPATTTFVGHGSGLGAAYVPAAALTGEKAAERIAGAIALDVALYDQRGCLSPHFVLVEQGGAVSAREFARVLSERALATWARTIPRGPLPVAAGALQMQWRGVAAARGELLEGDAWAVSYEGDHPVRLSPGYRNVAVHDCAGLDDLGARLRPFGTHLKALGLAGPAEVRRMIARRLPPPLSPRISAVGAMQTPGLLASADGEPPWSGLVRLRDVD